MKSSKIPPPRPRGGGLVLSLLDPLHGPLGPYNLKNDSSHLILLSLARRGYKVFYSDPSSLLVRQGRVMVHATKISVLQTEPYFTFQEEETLNADDFSLILMRKDPPVDPVYLHTTHLLSLVSKKVWVINNPEALRNWNEKMIILNFPRWIPPTLVTANKQEIDIFVKSLGGVALAKPLDGFAGKGVRKLIREEADYITVVEELTFDGTKPVMIQAFLLEVAQGEKRVFWVDGRSLGALLKIPPEGGFITNPDLGGHLSQAQLTKKEQKLIDEIGPFLEKNGIFFAGIDLIGEKLTEINITSPGLLWEWNGVDNSRHEEEIVNRIEKYL